MWNRINEKSIRALSRRACVVIFIYISCSITRQCLSTKRVRSNTIGFSKNRNFFHWILWLYYGKLCACVRSTNHLVEQNPSQKMTKSWVITWNIDQNWDCVHWLAILYYGVPFYSSAVCLHITVYTQFSFL